VKQDSFERRRHKVNFIDILYGVLVYIACVAAGLLILIFMGVVNDTFYLFSTFYLLVIPLVVCTRVILRAINGHVKGDEFAKKLKDFF
jgi:uncharacterized Tic20 family protein